MSEPRCERSDLPESMCSHCRAQTRGGVTRRMPAQYRTTCSCGNTINPGDMIGQVAGNWACPECASEAS